MIAACCLAGVLNCLQERFDRQLIADRDIWRHRELGVADVLSRHIRCHLVGDQADIVGVLDQSNDREIVPDEVGEVIEDEEPSEVVWIARHYPGMPRGQLGDDALRH